MSQRTLPLRPQQVSQQIPPRPRGPALGVRRFGRNDFERFDQEAARGSHLCVGSTTIGKVDIDCKYHWKKAQWGVLGAEKRPAGIVYMDITFKQPHGWWLQNASVFVTMSEDKSSYALMAPRGDRAAPAGGLASDYAVQITNYFGPRFLTGTKTIRNESRHMRLTPTVGGAGIEVGGMGFESTSSREKVGRWVFKGNVCKPKGRDGLRTLHWELNENVLDPEQAHSQEFHTGFAFEHSRRPVYLRVEMEGRLLSKGQQLQHGIKRFSSHGLGRKDDSTLMHIDFGRDFLFEKSLDAISQGLDMAMQMENVQQAPVETPDPMPAIFTRRPRTASSNADPVTGIEPSALGAIQGRGEPRPGDERETLLRLLTAQTVQKPAPAPAAAAAERRPVHHQAERTRVMLEESEETLVMLETRADARDESLAPESEETESVGTYIADATPARYPNADDALLDMLKIPAILYILRVLVMITSAFGRLPQSSTEGQQQVPRGPPRGPKRQIPNGVYRPGHQVLEPQNVSFRLDGMAVDDGLPPGLSRRLVGSQGVDGRANGFMQRGQQTRIRSW
ncbi:DNA-directed RNA polymerase I polypeptide 2 [Purpureocillium lavendulum]|uniref:DNA-directed RNA polymerase I polypeptide 2 n=1 Tax=Purpureocillium lavendulum TaxID=1247861 RepID=A0AB34G1Z5_9HYPO|nr:DNA-directed RNA polymerase I polypeptide 2 [Purpureocillium lavendulum]